MLKLLRLLTFILVSSVSFGCLSSGGNDHAAPADQDSTSEVTQSTPISTPGEPASDDANANSADEGSKPESTSKGQGLVLGSLKQVISEGCSCSAYNPDDNSGDPDNPKFLFITDLGPDSPAYLNVNGKDTKFKLIKRGDRPDDPASKTPYSDLYEAGDLRLRLDYKFKKSSCPDNEECESSEYDVTITLTGGEGAVTKKVTGICGC